MAFFVFVGSVSDYNLPDAKKPALASCDIICTFLVQNFNKISLSVIFFCTDTIIDKSYSLSFAKWFALLNSFKIGQR